jgi:hypothetical protein
MQKHCAYVMHKVHRDYKNVKQRREGADVERNYSQGNDMLWERDEIHKIGVIQSITIR